MNAKDMQILRRILPFRFLSTRAMTYLTEHSELKTFPAGHYYMRQGDRIDRQIYLNLSGTVEVIDELHQKHSRISTIESGHYFGEWEAIFDIPRLYTIRGLMDCSCVVFDGQILLELFRTEEAFSQAFAAILRDRQGIFRSFELFRAEVLRGVGFGHIHLNKILPLYEALEPALHSGATNADIIDFAALDYAVRRLPSNVGSTFAFLIRDELPSVFEEPDTLFKPILTDARRRAIWEVLPGKDLITVRSGMSDIMDFLTCLCVFSVESRKIRKRLYEGNVIRALRTYLDSPSFADAASEAQFIHSLGFTPEEVSGLMRVWGKQTVLQLWNTINHREMFSVDIRRQLNQYNLKNFTLWSSQIGDACRELMGVDPRELHESTGVHIISSNTHSITNCLNPWYASNAEAMRTWARSVDHPLLKEEWHNPFDFIYAIARDYFKAYPQEEKAMVAQETECGILRLGATASTGIEVQVIDLSKRKDKAIDPDLPQKSGSTDLVINIDFAFGEQAEDIIHQLLLLFGHHVRSVNFLGKAGALVGKRSDILVPTAFIEQNADTYLSVPPTSSACGESIRKRLPGKSVHLGPMLTVQGTLLQNRAMLQFYRQLWNAQGIEMEGYFYHRQVEEAKETGLISSNVASRFFYYVSDLPLDSSSNLSERLRAGEGIPPLYAISREILAQIFTA